MEKVEILEINNLRYSVIETEKGYYLIDNDRNWWRYVFPTLNWLIPDEAMKINLTKMEIQTSLLDDDWLPKTQEKDKERAMFWAVLLGGPAGMSVLNPILDKLGIYLPIYISLIIVMFISLWIFNWKIKNSRKAKEILNIIGLENLAPKQKMKIFPTSISQGLKILSIFHLVVSFMLFCKFHFLIIEPSVTYPLLFFGGAMLLFGYLYINTLFRTLMGKYRIKILDNG